MFAICSACSERLLEPLVTEEPAETPITVTSAEPALAEQGDTVAVTIRGTGFSSDVTVGWELNGSAQPQIQVQNLSFVSDTEIVATVAIGMDALVTVYDIAVRRPRKKGVGSEFTRGVGAELFRVLPYEPTPLGWLPEGLWGGSHSVALAVNNHGMVVGVGGDVRTHLTTPVLWTAASGLVAFGGVEGMAFGINDRGWIVGARGERIADLYVLYTDPFIFENGALRELPHLASRHPSHALAINQAGTIVGWGSRNHLKEPTWPIVWRRRADGSYSEAIELPLRNGEQWKVDEHLEGSRASAINRAGDIVGTISYDGRVARITHAVLWKVRPDGGYDPPIDLGGVNTEANGINDAGWIVGKANGRAVLWHPSDYGTPIPTFPSGSSALAINNRREVVVNTLMAAFLWKFDESGIPTEVVPLPPSPGFAFAQATAVNDHGIVVGWNGSPYQATLWRPRDEEGDHEK